MTAFKKDPCEKCRSLSGGIVPRTYHYETAGTGQEPDGAGGKTVEPFIGLTGA